jgi:hypothetical protein
MARIRSIKPEFWTSEQVVECSAMARLLFIGLWNFCDDAGRHTNSAKQIKAEVFPADDISLDTIRGLILELSKNGLIETYTIEEKELLQVTGWHHQRIDKPQKAKYPPPKDVVEDHSKNDPGTFPPDRKGEDRIGEEGKRAGAREPDDVVQARVAIVRAFEAANSPNPPDTSRVEVWKAQGYDLKLCVATVADGIKRKPSISTLAYFDGAIRDAHANRNPSPAIKTEPDWNAWVAKFTTGTPWPRMLGPEPGYAGCRAPPDVLRKHGIDPLTGGALRREAS